MTGKQLCKIRTDLGLSRREFYGYFGYQLQAGYRMEKGVRTVSFRVEAMLQDVLRLIEKKGGTCEKAPPEVKGKTTNGKYKQHAKKSKSL